MFLEGEMMKTITQFIFLFATAIVVTNCSPRTQNTTKINTQSPSIINGIPVTAEQILSKSVVGILMSYQLVAGEDKVWQQGCTGTVLNRKFILTAAHCVNYITAEDLAINFSSTSLLSDNQLNPATRITDIAAHFVIRKVKSFIQHPDYDETGKYDLALILLETDAPEDSIPVQILPDQFVNIAENKTTFDQQKVDIILMGFGVISESPRTDTDILRMTTVTGTFENQFVITDQTRGSGGCNGDSGGPAFYTLDGVTYQVGVTHGAHGSSTTCHEQGEWVNPALNKKFLISGQEKLLSERTLSRF